MKMELDQLSKRIGVIKAAGPARSRFVTVKLAESLIRGKNSG